MDTAIARIMNDASGCCINATMWLGGMDTAIARIMNDASDCCINATMWLGGMDTAIARIMNDASDCSIHGTGPQEIRRFDHRTTTCEAHLLLRPEVIGQVVRS